MPHRTGPSPGNHTAWLELLLAPLPVKRTGNVSCHVQIHRRRGFGVGASINDQATEDQHRRSGHSLCMGTQLTHGQIISCKSSGGRFLRLHGRFDTQEPSCRQRQQLGAAHHGHTCCSASSITRCRPSFIPPHHAAGSSTGQSATYHTAPTGQRTRPGRPSSQPKNSGGNSNTRENNPGADRPLDSRGRPTRDHPPRRHRARSR